MILYLTTFYGEAVALFIIICCLLIKDSWDFFRGRFLPLQAVDFVENGFVLFVKYFDPVRTWLLIQDINYSMAPCVQY